MKRIYFSNKENLNQFFREIKVGSSLSWSKISKNLNTTRSMIDNYRNGRLLIPEDRFLKLLSLLESDEKRKYFQSLVKNKDENWGQVIGGINAYKINKKSFDKGRRKGNIFRKKFGLKYNFDINMPLSEQLCEFLGVIIGDGCTNKYGHMHQTQISGDKILDKEYYLNNLSIICKNLFNIIPRIVIRPKGMYMNLYSKRVFELLTERFKIPRGIKCYTVKIPEEIFKAPKEMLNSTLRGMFNTDGGIGIDKRKIYKKPYIRINYTSTSPLLIDQISKILATYNIPHSIHNTNNNRAKQVQINGEKNVKLFLFNIGFSNPRHYNKVKHLLA